MASLQPLFSLQAGSFQTISAHAVGGPARLLIERDMLVAADGLEVDLVDRGGIQLGDPVVVALGHDVERNTVFTGSVAELRETLHGVRIRAFGRLNALLDLRVSAVYERQTAGDIVRDLLMQAGLETGSVDDGPSLPRFAVDRRLCAYRHLRALAERLGYELYGDRDGKVMFHALGSAAALDAGGLFSAAAPAVDAAMELRGAATEYAVGKHLIAAVVQQRVAGPCVVEVGGESPMSSAGSATAHWLSAKGSDNHAGAGDGSTVKLMLDPAARTKDLAGRFAAGYLSTLSRRARHVSATVLGRSGLELGDTISLTGGADALANSSGYVQALRHRFSTDSGFVTDVRVVLTEPV